MTVWLYKTMRVWGYDINSMSVWEYGIWMYGLWKYDSMVVQDYESMGI